MTVEPAAMFELMSVAKGTGAAASILGAGPEEGAGSEGRGLILAAWLDCGAVTPATTRPTSRAQPNPRPKPAPSAREGRNAVPINAISGKRQGRADQSVAIIREAAGLIAARRTAAPRLRGI